MNDLIAFLRARLDEEQDLARRLADRYIVRNPDLPNDGQPYWPLPSVERNYTFRKGTDPDIAAALDLIKAYNPHRVLTELDAKRQRLDWIEGELADDPANETAQWLARLEAAPYAGRDGYRAEWRP